MMINISLEISITRHGVIVSLFFFFQIKPISYKVKFDPYVGLCLVMHMKILMVTPCQCALKKQKPLPVHVFIV